MFELGLIFVSGLLGSSHCIGMCGPFAISIGTSTTTLSGNLKRQLLYSVGRIFTYTFAGAAAGFAGMRLATQFPRLPAAPAALAIFAGVVLIYQGLKSAGVRWFDWLRPSSSTAALPCSGGSMLKTFLTSRSSRDIFLAGVFTGFLPCGLVYAFLALAASTTDFLQGSATMMAFGCGTVPVMVATGCSTSLISPRRRQRLLRVAAWCVVLAGAISVSRGVAYWNTSVVNSIEACPFCNS